MYQIDDTHATRIVWIYYYTFLIPRVKANFELDPSPYVWIYLLPPTSLAKPHV
jgi:hypothetical protein